MSMRDLALSYIDRGWSVFPVCTPLNLTRCVQHGQCAQVGKKPLVAWKPYQSRLATPEEIDAWFTEWPNANIAMATGLMSGIVVVDLDNENAAEEAERLGYDAGGPSVTTGREGGGTHLYFAYRPDAPTVFAKDNGIDFRGQGGYVMMPGSLHKSGRTYEWAAHPAGFLPELPRWIDTMAGSSKGSGEYAAPLDTAAVLAGLPESQRDVYLFKLAAKLRRTDVPIEYAMALVRHAAEQCDPPFDDWEAKVHSAYKYKPTITDDDLAVETDDVALPTLSANMSKTDTGNAYRLVRRHGENIRYVAQWRSWLVWDGQRWSKDERGRVMELAKETADSIIEEAKAASDDKERAAMAKWWSASQSEKLLKSMVNLARTDPRVAIGADALDKSPWLFNVRNGTLDLRTGVLQPHDRADMLTKLADVEYDEAATAPRWMAFLNQIFNGSTAMIDYHRRALGYSLTGDASERVVFFQYGHGSNGKSTLLEAVRSVFGEYATVAPATMLMSKIGDEGVSNDVARLAGARFVAASESDDGKRLAEAKIKQLTGNETITARFMYQEFFEFKPQFKIWFATNHKPDIRGSDNAIWNRIKLLPYTTAIPVDQQDPALARKLSGEAAGILAWAVQGCLEWQRDGLGDAQEISAATDDYRTEMDSLGDFLDGFKQGPTLRIQSTLLYKMYVEWSQGMGERPMSNRKFSSRLRDRGYDHQKSNGGAYWMGIGNKAVALTVDAVWNGEKLAE